MFNTTTNTFSPSYNQSNSLNINAVSGMLVKNHPKSFIVQCQFGSEIADRLFNTENPYWIVPEKGYYFESFKGKRVGSGNHEDKDVIVLQVLLCGDNRVMCEIVFKEDWEMLM